MPVDGDPTAVLRANRLRVETMMSALREAVDDSEPFYRRAAVAQHKVDALVRRAVADGEMTPVRVLELRDAWAGLADALNALGVDHVEAWELGDGE